MKYIKGLLAFVVSFLLLGQTAFAHVVVKPAEVQTAAYQTFVVSVPNERQAAVTTLKLDIPDGLKSVTPTVKAGWVITSDKTGEGESASVKSITWNGTIPAGYRDDFTFSAQVPDKAADLQWKAHQTYEDGVTVNWDQAPTADERDDDKATSGPYSVTKVVAVTTVQADAETIKTDASNAKRSAQTAELVAFIAVVVGLAGLYFATKKKR